MEPRNRSRDVKRILKLTIQHRIFVFVLLLMSSTLQRNFDTSPSLQLLTSSSSLSHLLRFVTLPLLRWDGLHFLGVSSPIPLPIPPSTASEKVEIPPSFGYNSEHTLAWQSGLEWVMRINGWIPNIAAKVLGKQIELEWNPISSILLTSAWAGFLSLFSPLLLYHLTLKQTSDHRFSFLASTLSILSPSPTTLITPSPESFFSFFTLLGLNLLAQQRSVSGLSEWIKLLVGTLCFTLAATFRANGILLAGFVWWKLGWEKRWRKPRIFSTLLRAFAFPLLTLLVWTAFLSSQRWAYQRFCSFDSPTLALRSGRRPWCNDRFPSVYSFVQEHYWNVGFLKYWSVAQLPNFLLAFPVLILAGFTCWAYYASDVRLIAITTIFPWSEIDRRREIADSIADDGVASKDSGISTSTSTLSGSTLLQKRKVNQDPSQSNELKAVFDPSSAQLQSESSSRRKEEDEDDSLLSFRSSPGLLPHIHFALVVLLVLLFNSHTQIALRFATPGGLPSVWWGFASILMRQERRRRQRPGGKAKGLGWKSDLLVGWLVIWNIVSTVLIGGFYPPA